MDTLLKVQRCLSQQGQHWSRLIWFCCVALTSLTSCLEQRPTVFVEVSVEDQQSPEGTAEIGVTALLRGQDPLRVRLYITPEPNILSQEITQHCVHISEHESFGRGSRPGEASPLNPSGDEIDLGSLEESDLGREETGEEQYQACHYVDLTLDREESLTGSLFTGNMSLLPADIGTRFQYRLRATGGGGTAWWPSAREESLRVEGLRAPISLQDVSPKHGSSQGGTRLLIKGEGFSNIPSITVMLGDRTCTNIFVESPHLISVVTPAGPESTFSDLSVVSGARRDTLYQAYYWDPPPKVIDLLPDQVPENEETLVAITGLNFEHQRELRTVTRVYELSVSDEATVTNLDQLEPLDAQVISSDLIEVVLPARPAGESKLVLRNVDDQLANASFFRLAPPVLETVTPMMGPDAPSIWILLEGSNLKQPAAVWFNDREAIAVQVNPEGTRARVLTPLHPGGSTSITWYNPDGQSASLEDIYRFVGPPRIFDAEPTILSRCGGGITTLMGVNFTEEMKVYFNGVEGEVISVNDEGTEAVVRAPSGGQAEGNIDLVLVGPDGRRSRRSMLLSFGLQPVVESLTPPRAPVWGGTQAVVRGSDLVVGSLFTIDGRLVERANFIADGCDSIVEVILPDGEAGLREMQVEAPNGISSRSPDIVEYIAPRFEPSEGLTAGYTNLKLRGLDLREGMRVTFSRGLPRALTRISDEEWDVLTPQMPLGQIQVEVRNEDGRGLISEELFTATQFFDQGPESLNATGECNHIAQADFNGDGINDLVLAMGSSSPLGLLDQAALLYLGNGEGLSAPSRLWNPGNGMNVYSADVDQDQDQDLLIINLFSERNFLLLNNGSGQFSEDPLFPSSSLGPSYDGGIFDADGDGDLDLFFMQTGDSAENQQFGPERLFMRESQSWTERSGQIDFHLDDVHDHDMTHGDLNEDGLDDVVIVVDNLPQSFPGNSNRVLLNQGGGRFERVDTAINNYPGDWLDVVLADLNSDGHLDIIMPQDYIEGISVVGTPSLAIFIGDGQGGFTDESFRSSALPPVPAFGVTPYDVDQDGDLDLMIAVYGVSFGDGSIEPFQSVLLLNDGNGNLLGGNASFDSVPFNPSAHFEMIDLDRDGRIDMVECAAESGSRIWRQRQEEQ